MTQPSVEAQFDFAEFRISSGKRDEVVAVLGYSLSLFIKWLAHQTGVGYGTASKEPASGGPACHSVFRLRIQAINSR
jgi:hypothetical protein